MNNVKYPIFYECSQYTLDEYWINVLQNCSNGKFPKGLSVINGKTMKITVNKKNEMIDINEDPMEMFKICMNIFKNKLGMTSMRDHKLLSEEFKKIKEIKNPNKTWDSLKKIKSNRDTCIYNFVLQLQNKHNFVNEEAIYICKLIKCGLLFKNIQNKHIIINNGKIQDITILRKKNNSFFIDSPINIKIKKYKTSIENPFKKELKKYIENSI